MTKVPGETAQKNEKAHHRASQDTLLGRSRMATLKGRGLDKPLAVAVHVQVMESANRNSDGEGRPTFLLKAKLWIHRHEPNFSEPLQPAGRLSLECGSEAGNASLKPAVEKASQYLEELINQVNAGYSLAQRSGVPIQLSDLVQDRDDFASPVREWLSDALLIASQLRFHLLAG